MAKGLKVIHPLFQLYHQPVEAEVGLREILEAMVVPVVAVVQEVVRQMQVVLVTPEVIHPQKEIMVVRQDQGVLLIPQEEAEELVEQVAMVVVVTAVLVELVQLHQ